MDCKVYAGADFSLNNGKQSLYMKFWEPSGVLLTIKTTDLLP